MAEIDQVYGQDYEKQALSQKINYLSTVISSDLVHHHFNTRLDTTPLWDGNHLRDDARKLIQTHIQRMNPKIEVQSIAPDSSLINMFPYFVKGPVEYFRVIDLAQEKVYLVYLTPQNMEPY